MGEKSWQWVSARLVKGLRRASAPMLAVWIVSLAIHAPVNAAGPAMPAAAPSPNPARRQPLTTTPFCDGSCTGSAHGTTPNRRLAVTRRRNLSQPPAGGTGAHHWLLPQEGAGWEQSGNH